MLEPSWVGRRVSVRRVVGRDAGGRVQLGDVVGDLVGLDAQTAVVETRSDLVEVPVEYVTAARLAEPSTADKLALEAVAARGLRPAESEALGGWILRADHGFTSRANSVLPLRAPGRPLDDALAEAREWYAARGLPLKIHVPVEARRLLDAELGERGWPFALTTHILTARLDRLRAPGSSADVAIRPVPDDDWLALYRGGAGLTDTARALLTRHDRLGFATLRRAGRVLAVARGAVDDGWLGVMAVEVDPDHRRQGLAGAVMAALWQWGVEQGARRGYLQVGADNAPAVRLYEKLGYWRHHDYHYRSEPTPGPGLAPP